ncbi:MAG: VOC family protein [Pelovirga sp.]
MPGCCIDHIAITAPSLAVGADFVRDVLGVTPLTGGEHPRMGTHNLLLRLGEALYLEVVAPNPQAPAPARPRWFALDRLRPDSAPALSTWVARTTDIGATAAASSEALGEIEPMSRGALNWLITIPADGSVPLDGVAPALIEWQTEVHPATRLPDSGLRLAELKIFHPDPDRVERLLCSLGFAGPIRVAAPPGEGAAHLLARINTPQGLRELSCPDPFSAGITGDSL